MKEYKVNVPEMIRRDDDIFSIVLDGKKQIDESFQETLKDKMIIFDDIPKDWLEEIKDEPKTAEENWDITAYPCNCEHCKTAYLRGHDDGEQNNELRHKPKVTFDRWFANNNCGIVCDNYLECSDCEKIQRMTWEACDENRGF